MKKRKTLVVSVIILFFLFLTGFICLGRQIFVWELKDIFFAVSENCFCVLLNDFSGNPRFIIQEDFAQKKQYWMKLPDLNGENSEYQIQSMEVLNEMQLMVLVLNYQDDEPSSYELWLCTPGIRETKSLYTWTYQEDKFWDIYSCKEGIILIEFFSSLDGDAELNEYQINRTLFPVDNPYLPFSLSPLHIIQSTTVAYSLSADDGIWYTDRYGNGYYGEEDGNIKQVFSNNGEFVSINNLAFSPTLKGIYFYNLDTGKDYWVGKEGEIKEAEVPVFDSVRQSGWEIKAILMKDEKTIHAFLQKEEIEQIIIITSEKEPKIFQQFSLSLSLWIPVAACLSLFLALIFSGIGWGIFYLYHHVQVIPITVKIAIAVVPVLLIGCTFIQQRSELIFYEKKLESGKSVLLDAVMLEAGKIDLEKLSQRPVDVNYFEDRIYQKLMQTWGRIKGLSREKADRMQNHLKFGYFWAEEEEVYPILDTNYVTTPAYAVLSEKEITMLNTCIQEKINVCGTYSWAGTEYLAAYSPVFSKDDSRDEVILGVVTCSLEIKELVRQAKEEARNLSLWVFQGLFLVVSAAIALLYISLRPLTLLKRFLKNVEENQQQNDLQVKGYNEVSELIGIFNRMAENIQDYMTKVGKIQKQYEPFVPDELVKLLGKKDIRDVEPGDRVQCRGSLAFIDMESFSRIQAETPADALVEQINQGLQKMIPHVRASEGQIVKFVQGGMLVLFPESEENAMLCMKKLLDDLHIVLPTPYYAGMDYREAELEVVGNKRRMEISVRAEDWRRSRCLQELSMRYGLGLVAAKSLIERINSQEKALGKEEWYIRYLGWVYLSDQREETEVYELVGQEGEEGFVQTAQIFDRGVYAFQQKQWQESREYFAEVLRINREDHASQHYFQLCDRKLCGEIEEDCYFDRI